MIDKLDVVPNFVLPLSHSSYTIAAPPVVGSLSDLKSRWVLLKQKVIKMWVVLTPPIKSSKTKTNGAVCESKKLNGIQYYWSL
jgi:hypothetical protein